MNSKKGMSPLIATVLLIAFAVAIGAMIMNWTSNVSVENDVNYCEDVSLVATESACMSRNKMQLSLKNNGQKEIAGVVVSVDVESGSFDFTVKDSDMIIRESLQTSLPFSYAGGSVLITVSPFIHVEDADEDMVVCSDAGFTQTSLPSC
ncbi:MAG: archaellin/type IV pilin N-terminal domain-containing protein [Candidatus Nanoarchaeia archaeon]